VPGSGNPISFGERRGRFVIEVRGAVQGVGFRPFVQRLAAALDLPGCVRNHAGGVRIEIAGSETQIDRFLGFLRETAPAAARVDSSTTTRVEGGEPFPAGFAILPSLAHGAPGPLPLDVATCDDCLSDLWRPGDRRWRYPFVSCAVCGPRYSILEALPWDRANTTMRAFVPCAECEAEYRDSTDRRFHAQTNACPACGPRIELRDRDGKPLAREEAALAAAVEALRNGAIVALKGLGGFQLVVDATRAGSVEELRRRKRRPEKPLAVMVRDVAAARAVCDVSDAEATVLGSRAAPIVLLRRRAGGLAIASAVAPENPDLGLMLACTPLHHLLLEDLGVPIVATSGNRSGDPICHDEAEAVASLGSIADFFLVHDRPIAHPIDDSVVRPFRGETVVLRAARGLAPFAVRTPTATPGTVGQGAYLKNTVAVVVGDLAHLSPHIGDLRSPLTRALSVRTGGWLAELLGQRRSRNVVDLDPHEVPEDDDTARVQHHHAHVLACMAENGVDEAILGVAWDGNGYGPDGTVWGGEFLVCDRHGYQRFAHLRTFPLPGAERAILEPRRAALGLLFELYGERALHQAELAPVRTFAPAERRMIARMLERGINSPRTSSMGRLFDVIASLLDLRHRVTFEGQAAMALEFAARVSASAGRYEIPLRGEADGVAVADWSPLVGAVVRDVAAGVPPSAIAASFHDALATLIVAVARSAGRARVALAGGCFQNQLLLELATDRLREAGFEPLHHRRVPPNDGAIALGQVVHVPSVEAGRA